MTTPSKQIQMRVLGMYRLRNPSCSQSVKFSSFIGSLRTKRWGETSYLCVSVRSLLHTNWLGELFFIELYLSQHHKLHLNSFIPRFFYFISPVITPHRNAIGFHHIHSYTRIQKIIRTNCSSCACSLGGLVIIMLTLYNFRSCFINKNVLSEKSLNLIYNIQGYLNN